MNENASRVVVLTNPTLHTLATVEVLIRAEVHVVGVLSASGLVGMKRLRSLIRRNGVSQTLSKMTAHLAYKLMNGARDQRLYEQLYPPERINGAIRAASLPVQVCTRYGEPEAMAFIRGLDADILVVHSGVIVPSRVMELPRKRLVIGGHPGLTQKFRGGYSSFRAIYQNQPEKIGWTVFHVDSGIDTGDIISQGLLAPEPGDSFVSVDWRLMLRIAEEQARIIRTFDAEGEIPRRILGVSDPSTLYGYPTLKELIAYRLKQRMVR